MDADALIEWSLERAVAASETPPGPPTLAAAIRHAVFPGGARVRPKLCVAVAHACAPDKDLTTAAAAGAALELLHCASLVHDDLPCFDAADMRRGKASVHVAYGEQLAVLTGDALIVMAFETLARDCAKPCETLANLVMILSRSVGAPEGICAGQAWESERDIDLTAYHRAKTGALFIGAATAGAAAVGASTMPWRAVGERLGDAYQVADDIRDAVLDSEILGKPCGQDERHSRPNAVKTYGLRGAVNRLNALVEEAASSVPTCDGADSLRALVLGQAKRLMPESLVASIA
ncbi:MAG: polyprenyl synthetase family protein [Pseudomonadota bacterium]